MSNINDLKQYNNKKREYKQLEARLKVINIELDNWDKVQASSVTDMPIHHDTDHGDKIGDLVVSREEKYMECDRLEYELAILSEFIINVDSLLECLEYPYRYLLEKIYKEGLIGKRSYDKLHECYVKDVKIISGQHVRQLSKEAEKKFNSL